MAKRKNLNLSKSTLIRSLQCQKSLYLYKYHYDERDPVSPEQQAVFDRGHSFGELAHDLFPGGKDVSPPKPWLFRQSVAATEALIRSEHPVIYEAAFRHAGVLVYLDILVRRNDGWEGFEVKSSRRIRPTYVTDAAIQHYVIGKCGLELIDLSIIHVRDDFDPEEHQQAEDIFVFRSVMDQTESMREFVQATITDAQQTLRKEDIPDISMGPHCDTPYPCDFKGFCSAREPDPPSA